VLVFTQIAPLKDYLRRQKSKKSLGFVPTMGALHNGHLSLVAMSKQANDITITSIFVNPTQFNNPTDLELYPRTLEMDMVLLEQAGCDVLFCPSVNEVYLANELVEQYHWGAITHSLEGAHRPGHFDGVITIVRKLFDWVQPNMAYFGKKDFQQCAVIRELVSQFKLPITLEFAETLREEDGLAMSSRNKRLTSEERLKAILISKALLQARAQHHLSVERVQNDLVAFFQAEPIFKVEYIAIVNQQSLQPLLPHEPATGSVVLIAVWCGNVRLIDSMVLQ
jgi:pantoate--beta-alanine ligase